MREVLQKKHCKLFSRSPPKSPTVEIKDEINCLSRTKILREEIHVNRLVAWVRPTVHTADTPAAPTFQLWSETSPPVELSDTANLSRAINKFLLDEVKLDHLVICSLVVPPHCSTGPAYFSSASNYLQSPQSPCVEIKDEVNCKGKTQKNLSECEIEEIVIDYPEMTSSHPVDRNTFRDENILQKPPVELSDRINKEVRYRRRSLMSLAKNEIFEIMCFTPVFINHYEYLRNEIFKDSPPQKPDIDLTDNCNKLGTKVKQLLDEANIDVIIRVPVSEEQSDGVKIQRMFSICEPQPLELILEDKVNRTRNISKIFSDCSLHCDSVIQIPVGFNQTKVPTKLEFEPFDTMVIPADIVDQFQQNIFNFNRSFASDQEGIYFNFPSCPICSSVVKIDHFLEAPPQSPPPETEDRRNDRSRLRKIFNDSIVINIQTESLPSLSSEYNSLLGSGLLARFPLTCQEEVFSHLHVEKNISQKYQEIKNLDQDVLLIPLLSPEHNPVLCGPQRLGTNTNIFNNIRYYLHQFSTIQPAGRARS